MIALWLAVVGGGLVALGLIGFRKMGRKDAIPFGPFLSMGAIVALLMGSKLTAWYNDLGGLLAVGRI